MIQLTHFAQTMMQSDPTGCTLNGQPIDCAELAHRARPFIGVGLGLLAFFLIIVVVGFVFWLVMLIHALKHNSPDRTIWIIVLLVSFLFGAGPIAAFVYLFAEKQRAEKAGLLPPTPPPTT